MNTSKNGHKTRRKKIQVRKKGEKLLKARKEWKGTGGKEKERGEIDQKESEKKTWRVTTVEKGQDKRGFEDYVLKRRVGRKKKRASKDVKKK